jgi:hypothetical protein
VLLHSVFIVPVLHNAIYEQTFVQ